MKNKPSLLICLLSIVLLTNSCGPKIDPPVEYKLVKEYSSEIPISWNELFLKIDRNTNYFRPGPSARALAYISLAGYETCVPGMIEYHSLKNEMSYQSYIPSLKDRRGIDYPLAINSCYAYLFEHLFANVVFISPYSKTEMLNDVNTLKLKNEALRKEELDNDRFFVNSKAWGEEIAQGIWTWSETDLLAANAFLSEEKARPDSNGSLGDGLWQSSNLGVKALFPYWSEVRRFAIPYNNMLIPLPYHTKDSTKSSIIFSQAIEVYNRCASVTNDPSTNNNDAWIAQFWSDDQVGLSFSPPSRFYAIADQIYTQAGTNLEQSILIDAQMGLSLNDAGVACWKNKFYYNIERPSNYIKRNIDPNWKLPWLPENPPSPSFPSAHATYAFAAAEILNGAIKNFSGLTDKCHESNNLFLSKPRFFVSFEEMALEIADSRIPLGVDFKMDADGGKLLGERVARAVLALPWKK